MVTDNNAVFVLTQRTGGGDVFDFDVLNPLRRAIHKRIEPMIDINPRAHGVVGIDNKVTEDCRDGGMVAKSDDACIIS